MFGTKITDEFFPIHTGGDVAFVNGVLKQLLAIGGVDRAFVDRAHRRVRRAARGARRRAVRRARTRVGRDDAPTWRASREMYAGREAPRCSCGRWASRSTRTASTTCARSSTSASRAATSAGRARASCRSAATPACRAAPRWAATPRRSPAASRSPPTTRPRLAGAVGLRRPGDDRVSPRPRWSTRRAAASSTCCGRAAATSSTCCPRPTSRAPRSRARRCACTRTSCSRTRCSSSPGEVVVLLPAATRYEQEGGGTSTTTERRVAFSPEIPGPRVGEARSEWQIFADVARRVRPDRADAVRLRAGRRDPRRDRARRARVRGHRAAARDGRRDPGRRRAPVRGRRVPDARRPGPVRRRRARDRATCPKAGSCCRPAAASSSTRWCGTTSTRSPARARDALFLAEADASALGVADGDAVLVRSRARRDAGRACTSRRSGPATCRRSFPRRTRCSPRRCATRSRACPTTTRSSKWSRSDDARRAARAVRRDGRRRARRASPRSIAHALARPHRAPGPVRARPRRRRGRVRGAEQGARCAS